MAQDPVTWREAPDLAEMAAPIIAAYHPHLKGFPLRFVWRSRGKNIGKRKEGDPLAAAGTAEIVTGRFAFFVMTDEEKEMGENQGCPGKMFWIEISEDVWRHMKEPERRMLLDHELCHCGTAFPDEKDGAEMFTIYHDVTEFEAIARRYGMETTGLESFAAALLGFEGA